MNQRPALLSLKQYIFLFIVSILSMAAALHIFDADIANTGSIVVVVVFIGLLQFVLGPLLQWIATRFGVLGIIIMSLISGPLIVYLALSLAPGITLEEPIDALYIGWTYALGLTLAQWMVVSQSNDILLAEIIRKSRKPAKSVSTKPGYLFIQLDGVSWPILDLQLKAGNLPNISKLIDDEGYVFRPWTTQLPSTTPVSQAGILLGSHKNIPAFRWYEKGTDKLFVANQPSDAALIEERLSSGDGLLVNGGVSIGNLFSGDAPTNIMVMSKLTGDRSAMRNMSDYMNYFTAPVGFMRAIILSFGEMAKELFQARRAESRNIKPRIKRHGSYILLRAITNVLLRSLQNTIVIQNMMKGVNSIYVDYLDYDEIAHHAGMARAESLAALTGLDEVVGLISQARAHAPRPYEIILLSDHGQSQGETFKQLNSGKTLEDFVSEYTNTFQIETATGTDEGQTSVRYLVGMGTSNKNSEAVARRVGKLVDKEDAATEDESSNIVVTGSGNLGNIWLKDIPGRASLEEINKKYPQLLDSLLGTKGIGLILVKSTKNGYLCISDTGTLELMPGKVTGSHPLAAYGEQWQGELLKLTSMDNAPDIAVISSYEPTRDGTHAFEELVGNHGGIGGWQTQGILLHPERFVVPEDLLQDGEINGSETLHKIFKQWISK